MHTGMSTAMDVIALAEKSEGAYLANSAKTTGRANT